MSPTNPLNFGNVLSKLGLFIRSPTWSSRFCSILMVVSTLVHRIEISALCLVSTTCGGVAGRGELDSLLGDLEIVLLYRDRRVGFRYTSLPLVLAKFVEI